MRWKEKVSHFWEEKIHKFQEQNQKVSQEEMLVAHQNQMILEALEKEELNLIKRLQHSRNIAQSKSKHLEEVQKLTQRIFSDRSTLFKNNPSISFRQSLPNQ